MIEAALLATVAALGTPTLPDINQPPIQQCGTATEYGYGTRWHGTHTATGERFKPRQERTCAHRTLPFGTTIFVQPQEGPGAWCRVNDRGPYMVTPADAPDGPRSYEGTSLKDGYRWDGVLDVSIATARASGVDGKEEVCIRYWSTPRRPERWSSYELTGGRQ